MALKWKEYPGLDIVSALPDSYLLKMEIIFHLWPIQYQHQIFKCRVKATLSLFGGILFYILYMYFACGGRELLIPCCWHVDGLQELVLFVGPETLTQVVRLGGRHLHLLNHLAGPYLFCCCKYCSVLDTQWCPYPLGISDQTSRICKLQREDLFLKLSPQRLAHILGGEKCLIKTITRLTILHYFKIVLLT